MEEFENITQTIISESCCEYIHITMITNDDIEKMELLGQLIINMLYDKRAIHLSKN